LNCNFPLLKKLVSTGFMLGSWLPICADSALGKAANAKSSVSLNTVLRRDVA
jgi:hypothetical protein